MRSLIVILGAAVVLAGAIVHGSEQPVQKQDLSTFAVESIDQRSLFDSEAKLQYVAYAQQCCKVCRKGKACGDTCISRDKVCRTPPGCACDG